MQGIHFFTSEVTKEDWRLNYIIQDCTGLYMHGALFKFRYTNIVF
jgi:hypothetical protein